MNASDPDGASRPASQGSALDRVGDVGSLPGHGLLEDVDPYRASGRSRLQRWLDGLERRVSILSTRNNFWHRVCAWVWLPLAYRSGIRFWKGEESTFSAVLPFNRFNKNWYNAMAGGALLGNAEVAGGMYVFERCGGDYTVVCKHLEYTFRRPCYGPAVYRIEPRETIEQLVAGGGEFNITVDMKIMQMLTAADEKEKRVGNCVATFHVTPKSLARKQLARMEQRAQERMRRIASQRDRPQ